MTLGNLLKISVHQFSCLWNGYDNSISTIRLLWGLNYTCLTCKKGWCRVDSIMSSYWFSLLLFSLSVMSHSFVTPLYSTPGSCVHGISQARITEWVAISYSRGSSWSRDKTHISCIGMWVLYHWATWKAPTSYFYLPWIPLRGIQHNIRSDVAFIVDNLK